MPLTGPDIILYEQKGGIAKITLNRPERLNALSPEIRERIPEVFERFDDDDEAKVAIVSGAGKSFCSGHDMKEPFSKRLKKHWSVRLDITKPTIAAVQGYALGGGWNLAMRCDIRIAGTNAIFGLGAARLNFQAGWTSDLTRHLSLGNALKVALWGDERITAQRAYEMGFVQEVVPPEKLNEVAMSWAERMLVMGPSAVKNIKLMICNGFYIPPQQFEEVTRAMEANLLQSRDIQEGLEAFHEKRKPEYTGR